MLSTLAAFAVSGAAFTGGAVLTVFGGVPGGFFTGGGPALISGLGNTGAGPLVGGALFGGLGRLSSQVPAFGLPGAFSKPTGAGGGAFPVCRSIGLKLICAGEAVFDVVT